MSATASPVEQQSRTSSQIILGVFVPHIIWIFLFEYLIYQTFRPTYFPLSLLAGAGSRIGVWNFLLQERPGPGLVGLTVSLLRNIWEILLPEVEDGEIMTFTGEILPGSLPPSLPPPTYQKYLTSGNYHFLLSICWTWNCYWILINERKRSKHGTEANLL